VNFFIVNVKGEHAGVSLYPATYAVCTESGARLVDAEALFTGEPGN